MTHEPTPEWEKEFRAFYEGANIHGALSTNFIEAQLSFIRSLIATERAAERRRVTEPIIHELLAELKDLEKDICGLVRIKKHIPDGAEDVMMARLKYAVANEVIGNTRANLHRRLHEFVTSIRREPPTPLSEDTNH